MRPSKRPGIRNGLSGRMGGGRPSRRYGSADPPLTEITDIARAHTPRIDVPLSPTRRGIRAPAHDRALREGLRGGRSAGRSYRGLWVSQTWISIIRGRLDPDSTGEMLHKLEYALKSRKKQRFSDHRAHTPIGVQKQGGALRPRAVEARQSLREGTGGIWSCLTPASEEERVRAPKEIDIPRACPTRPRAWASRSHPREAKSSATG
jgi:hypothetical protein